MILNQDCNTKYQEKHFYRKHSAGNLLSFVGSTVKWKLLAQGHDRIFIEGTLWTAKLLYKQPLLRNALNRNDPFQGHR